MGHPNVGDCCSNPNTNYCQECTCYLKETCRAGFFPSSVGDGLCNDENNNEECSYDFGDCCQASDLVGNFICNDEANHPECNFDGGDCCLTIKNTDYCSQCLCSVHGVITTLQFPQYYDKYFDISWLIQLVHGQFIWMNFVIFDLEHDSICRCVFLFD